MAKKDGGKNGRRIPKRIAGVKVPKELRRGGEALIGALEDEGTRYALATGLKAAAGVLAASVAAKIAADRVHAGAAPPEPPHPPQPPRPPEPPRPDTPPEPPRAPGEGGVQQDRFGEFLGLAATTATAAMQGWLARHGERKADAGGTPEAPGAGGGDRGTE